MNIFRKTALIVSVVIAVLVICGFIANAYFQKHIVEIVERAIDKNINSKIEIDNISFSVFKGFPYASVILRNVVVKSSPELNSHNFKCNTDTLFFARNVYLRMNIIRIIKKQYSVEEFVGEKGIVCMYVDKQGETNYNIFRKKQKTDTAKLNLELHNIELKNMDVRYVNLLQSLDVMFDVSRINFKGNFSSSDFMMNSKSKINIAHLLISDRNIFKNKKTELELKIHIKNNFYKIQNCELKIGNAYFNLKGDIKSENEVMANLEVVGSDLNIPEFISLLPEKINEKTKEYKINGEIKFNTKIEGIISRSKIPHISSVFSIKNAEATDKKTQTLFENISLEGTFTNGTGNCMETSVLEIRRFNARTGNSYFKGSFAESNLKNPFVASQINGKVFLKDITGFLSDENYEIKEGEVDFNISFSGRINKLGEITKEEITQLEKWGTLSLKGVKIFLKKKDNYIDNLTGDILVNNNIEAKNTYFKYGESDYLLNGKAQNAINYLLFDDNDIYIDASLKSENLNYKETATLFSDSQTDTVKFPLHLFIKGDFSIRNFKYEEYIFENCQGNALYQNKNLKIYNTAFEAAKGKVTGNSIIEQLENNNIKTDFDAKLENIDIKNLFAVFNNFSQEFIVEKHIQGRADAETKGSMMWSETMTAYMPEIKFITNIVLRNGKLTDFAPLRHLSKYMNVDELKDISFSEMNNIIKIENQTVNIPSMNIKSSAANITVFGTHNFDNEYEYHLTILLPELISKKFRLNNKQFSKYGEIEDDGLGQTKLFLVMKGKGGEFKISYDKDALKGKLQQDVEKEKQEIKSLLKEELGLFKNDTSVKIKEKEPEKGNNVIFEWEEEIKQEKKPVENEKKTEKKEKKEKSELQFEMKIE